MMEPFYKDCAHDLQNPECSPGSFSENLQLSVSSKKIKQNKIDETMG